VPSESSDDIWTIELPIEFEKAPAPAHTVYYFWDMYRAENLPLKEDELVLFRFCQHPHFTAAQQDRADQGLVDC
jgi:hypothetical protein